MPHQEAHDEPFNFPGQEPCCFNGQVPEFWEPEVPEFGMEEDTLSVMITFFEY